MATIKTAEDFAKEQKEISVSEFFEKNKHLLGFDNPTKALLMAVKEAVDNSLDACEESGVLPDISVKIKQLSEDKYRITVQDNGPGIVKEQVPRIFGKLLYGSKFHRLRQSLTGDEPILVEIDGKCNIVPIGELIDKFLDKDGEVDISHTNIKVPCFDWGTYRYEFRNATHLIKHKRRNEIIRIRTRYNKEIKVTGCHSLFMLDKETMEVKEVAARDLKIGDLIVVPKKLPEPRQVREICLLDYVSVNAAKKNWWYLYLPKDFVQAVFSKAEIVHKKNIGDKSRKYYRFFHNSKNVDIVDDSYKQYLGKGFIPVWLAKPLLEAGILKKDHIEDGIIRSYYHGRPCDIAAVWPLTPLLMKFLGLFVAEGHTDKRHVGITLNVSENSAVKTVTDFAIQYGINAVIEKRPRNAVRVKLFGGILATVLRAWCGHRAENKRIPDFVFHGNPEMRQHFIDYLYVGDGHNTKKHNQLMHSTVSERLARELSYIWLLQGVQPSISKRRNSGYGNSTAFVTTIYGEDIRKSFAFEPNRNNLRATRRKYKYLGPCFWAREHGLGYSTGNFEQYERLFASLSLSKTYSYDEIAQIIKNPKPGYKLRNLKELKCIAENNGTFLLTEDGVKIKQILENLRKFQDSDLTAVKIVEKNVTNHGHEYVYDISVPEGENFVGGLGGIACHNSRGQQGIGISAVLLYSQLTTGNPTRIWSKTGEKNKTYYCELFLNTTKNEPEIAKEEVLDKDGFSDGRGVKVEFDVLGRYRKTIEDYLRQTSIANPFAKIAYMAPDGTKTTFPRSNNEIPRPPKEMKLHPYGVELGILLRMLGKTNSKTLASFLSNEFSSIGAQSAKEICKIARVDVSMKPGTLTRDQSEKLLTAMQKVKIQRPPLDCLSPIGSDDLEKSLKKEFPNAEFITVVEREPEVYRGMPFQIECGIVYGGDLSKDEQIELIRFANRVPLLYQAGACGTSESVKDVDWKRYGLQQSKNSLPVGPMVLVVHVCSVWVPFVSESKEAIAPYPEITKEIKLTIQDAARNLSRFLSGRRRAGAEKRRLQIFERYAGEVASSLALLTKKPEKDIEKKLRELIANRSKLKEFEKTENGKETENAAAEEPKEGEE